jgi:membrane dipeptidase
LALDAWMMVPGWVRGQSTPKSMNCSLETMADHIDHIGQIDGSASNVAIGSDLDGAYGTEQCPYDVQTIADLQKIPDILRQRGYAEKDLQAIASGNLIGFLQSAL